MSFLLGGFWVSFGLEISLGPGNPDKKRYFEKYLKSVSVYGQNGWNILQESKKEVMQLWNNMRRWNFWKFCQCAVGEGEEIVISISTSICLSIHFSDWPEWKKKIRENILNPVCERRGEEQSMSGLSVEVVMMKQWLPRWEWYWPISVYDGFIGLSSCVSTFTFGLNVSCSNRKW